MRDVLAIALAGAAGSLARYGVGLLATRLWPGRFALGTLVVNVVGCFLLAVLMTAGLSHDTIPRWLKLALATGFLGAFTTFSTFGYETLSYLERGALRMAALNVAANLVLGLGAAWLGMLAARVWLAR